eukprot:TRINITY_DN3449_c0_g1_i2.p1 TRINITY_DN3449_c0_g1~~TRINITY_DN3449_c0_g1_i2.p1  ORF type:complete len:818 (+),score=364.48 TRINITY_DN3449_c0_g1_i2:195-2648(+)
MKDWEAVEKMMAEGPKGDKGDPIVLVRHMQQLIELALGDELHVVKKKASPEAEDEEEKNKLASSSADEPAKKVELAAKNFKAALADKDAQIEALRLQLEEASVPKACAKCDVLASDVHDLDSKLQAAQSENQQLAESNAGLQAGNDVLCASQEVLQEDAAAKTSDLNAARESNAKLQAEAAKLRNDNETLQAEADTSSHKLKLANTEVARLRPLTSQVTRMQQQLDQQTETSAAQVAKLKKEVTKLEDEQIATANENKVAFEAWEMAVAERDAELSNRTDLIVQLDLDKAALEERVRQLEALLGTSPETHPEGGCEQGGDDEEEEEVEEESDEEVEVEEEEEVKIQEEEETDDEDEDVLETIVEESEEEEEAASRRASLLDASPPKAPAALLSPPPALSDTDAASDSERGDDEDDEHNAGDHDSDDDDDDNDDDHNAGGDAAAVAADDDHAEGDDVYGEDADYVYDRDSDADAAGDDNNVDDHDGGVDVGNVYGEGEDADDGAVEWEVGDEEYSPVGRLAEPGSPGSSMRRAGRSAVRQRHHLRAPSNVPLARCEVEEQAEQAAAAEAEEAESPAAAAVASAVAAGDRPRVFMLELGDSMLRWGVTLLEQDTAVYGKAHNCIARPKKKTMEDILLRAGMGLNNMFVRARENGYFVADEAYKCTMTHPDAELRANLNLTRPMERGLVVAPGGDVANSDLMLVVDSCLQSAGYEPEYDWSLSDTAFIVVYKSYWTRSQIEGLCVGIFNRFPGLEKLRLVDDATMVAAAAVAATGCIVSIGEGVCSVTPVYEGAALPGHVLHAAVGSADVDNYLKYMLDS